MSTLLKPLALGLAALALGLMLAPSASAQDRAPRLLNTWEDPVKLPDGSETVYRYEVTYDYDTGVALRTAYDTFGNTVEVKEMAQAPAPSAEEIAEAMAIVQGDAELSALAAARNATVDGGFLLYGDQIEACAAPARCLQFDIMGPDKIESVRFVVVDLRTGQIVERDLFPDL